MQCWGSGWDGQWGDGTPPRWPTGDGTPSPAPGHPDFWAEGGRIAACQDCSAFDSPTAPKVPSLEGVDRVIGRCALAGATLYCFGPSWADYAEPEPGVVHIATGVVSFDRTAPTGLIYVVETGEVFHRELGAPDAVPLTDGAVEVVVGGVATCVRDQDGGARCWNTSSGVASLTSPPRTLEVDGPVTGLIEGQVTRQGRSTDTVCALPGPRCALPIPDWPADDPTLHDVEVAP